MTEVVNASLDLFTKCCLSIIKVIPNSEESEEGGDFIPNKKVKVELQVQKKGILITFIKCC